VSDGAEVRFTGRLFQRLAAKTGKARHMGTAIKHPVADRVKPSFIFLTSGHSDAQP